MSERKESFPSAARAAGLTSGAGGALVRAGTPTAGHLFAYGTLELPVVMSKLTGRHFDARAALLSGHARYLLAHYPYPAIVEDPGASVAGTVYLGLDAPALALLDAYEGNLYERCELSIGVDGAVMQAQCYVLRGEFHGLLSKAPWDRHEFESRHLASYLSRL